MKKERLGYLIDVSRQRKATREEQRELNAWYASFEQDRGYTDHLDVDELDALRRRMLLVFEQRHFHKRWWQHRGYWSAAAAAMVAIVMAAGIWFYPFRPSETSLIAGEVPHDLLPGSNRATLTLTDGRTIDLNEAQTGIVVSDGITYLDGSSVLGKQVNERTSEQADPPTHSQVYTLTTPKGGTYQITLPDGTDVWLNAASTLTYPSHFTGDERVVELEGEAYFDVSERWSVADDRSSGTSNDRERSLKVPFLVKTNFQTVEVLGTQFNVSAYPDEPETKTTLIKGSVRLSANRTEASIILTPGEQGSLEAGKLSKQPVNVSAAMAWKNGDFMFDNEPLESIMKKLARWYDAEVVYEGTPKGLRLYGIVSRSKNISTVLDVMEMTEKVKFKVESPATGHNERRIVVMQ